MTEITRALARAFASLAHPRMLALMIWPLAVALVLWTVLAIIFGAQTVAWLQGYLTTSTVGIWASHWFPFGVIAAVLSWVALFVLFVPLVLVTATLIIGVVSMPAMVKHVAAADYPSLERRQGGTFAGSVWNALAALDGFRRAQPAVAAAVVRAAVLADPAGAPVRLPQPARLPVRRGGGARERGGDAGAFPPPRRSSSTCSGSSCR